jgi:hypothetical protein
MTTTNLPPKRIDDSAAGTKLFFDSYGTQPLEFLASEVDAVEAFFTARGFSKQAALVSAGVILKQAKLDATPVFQILDTIANYQSGDLSLLVAEILNNNRSGTSTLGFKNVSRLTNRSRQVFP